MLKKILVGALIGVVLAVLVAGAVLRTMDKTGVNDTRGYGQGGGRAVDSTAPLGSGSQWDDGQSPRWGQQEPTQGQQLRTITIVGSVVGVDENALTVQVADGSKVIVENRPWWFALERKFAAKVGDQVKLTGFYDGSTFETVEIENVTSDKMVQLRDEYERPGWAGRGRRGSW